MSEVLAPPSRTPSGTNWSAAFVMFCKGASLDEIAETLKIPFSRLRDKARNEDWANLSRNAASIFLKAPSPGATTALQVVNAEQRIIANREDSLTVTKRLRDEIVKVLDTALAKGNTLTIDEITKLARANAQLDVTSTRALGDRQSSETPEAPDAPEAAKGDTNFYINLPGMVSAPRGTIPAGPAPGEVTELGHRDAITAPIPGVELAPEAIESEIIDVGLKRKAINFDRLGKLIQSASPDAPKISVPAMFQDLHSDENETG